MKKLLRTTVAVLIIALLSAATAACKAETTLNSKGSKEQQSEDVVNASTENHPNKETGSNLDSERGNSKKGTKVEDLEKTVFVKRKL